MNISLSAFAPDYLVSRDGFGSPVPHQPTHLHTQADLVLTTGFLPSSAAAYLVRFPLPDGVFLPCDHGLYFDYTSILCENSIKKINEKAPPVEIERNVVVAPTTVVP